MWQCCALIPFGAWHLLVARAVVRDSCSAGDPDRGKEPPCEAAVFAEPGVPADRDLVAGARVRDQEAGVRLASGRAVNGGHWPGAGGDQGIGVGPGTVACGAEDASSPLLTAIASPSWSSAAG